MPISPYYKRLWTEDLNQQPPPYSLGTTPTQRPEQSLDLGVNRESLFDPEAMPPQPTPRYSLGITPSMPNQRNSLGLTNTGPNLGVQLPDPFAPMPEEPAKLPNPNIARSRALRLPQPGDINDNSLELSPWAPRLMNDDTLIKQAPRYSLGLTKTRFPYNLGVDLYKQDEAPTEQLLEQPESAVERSRRLRLPQPGDIDTQRVPIPDMEIPQAVENQTPRLADLEITQDSISDPSRRRALYTALAQFTAGMGNIAGKPTETTVPEYMKDLNAQDVSRIDQRNKIEDLAIRRAIRQTENLKAQALADKSKRDTSTLKAQDDPLSEESRMANRLLRSYYSKYVSGDVPLPDNIPASTIYKFLPGLSNIVRGEIGGQFGLQQTQLRGEQALTQQESRFAAEERLARLKAEYDLLKNDNTVQGQIEKARLAGEINKELEDMKGKYRVDVENIGAKARENVANITAKSREKAAQIGAGARIGATKIAQEGANKRQLARVSKADNYRQYKEIKGAAAEYKKDPIVRNYLDITNNVKALERNINNPSGVGDLATVYNFVKALDPGSVVREGEIALMQQAQGIKDQMLNILGRFEGKKFTPDMRQTILQQMKQMQALAGDNVKWLNDTVKSVAKEGGWNPDSFLIRFGGQGPGISIGAPAQQPGKIKVWKPGGAK